MKYTPFVYCDNGEMKPVPFYIPTPKNIIVICCSYIVGTVLGLTVGIFFFP